MINSAKPNIPLSFCSCDPKQIDFFLDSTRTYTLVIGGIRIQSLYSSLTSNSSSSSYPSFTPLLTVFTHITHFRYSLTKQTGRNKKPAKKTTLIDTKTTKIRSKKKVNRKFIIKNAGSLEFELETGWIEYVVSGFFRGVLVSIHINIQLF